MLRCYVLLRASRKCPALRATMVCHYSLEHCARGQPANLAASNRGTREIVSRLLVPALCVRPAAGVWSARRPGFDPGILYPAAGDKLSRSSGASEGPVSFIS